MDLGAIACLVAGGTGVGTLRAAFHVELATAIAIRTNARPRAVNKSILVIEVTFQGIH
jgi:hypothetical protein